MSLVYILFNYFGLPIIALMLTKSSFDMKSKYKKIYPNDLVTAFNIQIKKVNVSLLLAISVLIYFFIILIINTLAYLSILNISSSEFTNLSLWEIFFLWIFLILYVIITDTKKKK